LGTSRRKRQDGLPSARRTLTSSNDPAASGTLSSAKAPPIVAACCLLAVVAALPYVSIFSHPFVNYDDETYLTQNPRVQAGLTFAAVRWAAVSTYAANWHPLTWMLHTLNWQMFHENASGHHGISLLLHVSNVILLFLILVRSTASPWKSWIAAAIFAVHPLNVESVAWIAETKNLLSTMFFLGGLMAYGWYAARPSVKRYVLVAVLFMAGLASKPMVITFPFVLLLVDVWPLSRVAKGSRPASNSIPQFSWGRLVVEKIPLMLLSAGSAVITIIAQGRGGAIPPSEYLPFSMRVANSICSYAVYLEKAFWPRGLAPFYPWPRVEVWQLSLAALFIAGVSALARKFRKRGYSLIGWLWFLGTLVPVIGVIQVGGQSRADRYTYLPCIGIYVLCVWAVADISLLQRMKNKSVAVLVAALLVALSLATWRQASYWQSDYDLWSHTLAVTTDNLVAEDNLGIALLHMGRSSEAMMHFQNAERLSPTDAISRINLGADYQDQNRLNEAADEYATAIANTEDPSLLATAYENLGKVYLRKADYVRAQSVYERLLAKDPKNVNAFLGLGRAQMGKTASALSETLRQQPSASGYLQLGQLLQQLGDEGRARQAYVTALKLDPKLHEAKDALGSLVSP